jgi:Putative glycosyl hydrolase domain/CarboxypepD_reg-like domain
MMKRLLPLLIFIWFLFITTAIQAYDGKVIDAQTKAPIAGAVVVAGDQMVRTDKDGSFHLEGSGEALKVKAAGYKRQQIEASAAANSQAEIVLEPFNVKALYLTVYGTAVARIRDAAVAAIEKNNMNALVIDVKGDGGFIPFKVDLPLAEEIGAQKTIVTKDMKATVAALKEKNLYLIARIVVFKDNVLGKAKPELAVRTKGGGFFLERERLR